MEGQGKRLLLAVALALGVMMLWQVVFPHEQAKKPPPPPPGQGSAQPQVPTASPYYQQAEQPDPAAGSAAAGSAAAGSAAAGSAAAGSAVGSAEAGSAVGSAGSAAAGSAAAGSAVGSAGSAVAPTQVAPAPVPTPEPPAPRAPEEQKTFTSDDVRIVMTNHGGSLASWTMLAPKYKAEHYKGEMVPPQGGGALRIYFPSSTHSIPPDAVWKVDQVVEGDEPTITYSWESPAMRIVKTFRLLPKDNLIKTKISVTPKQDGRQTLAVTMFGYQDPRASTAHARGNTEWKAACLSDEVRVAGVKQLLERARLENGVRWAGYSQGYVPGGRLTAAQAGQFLFATAPWANGPNDLFACNAYADPTRPGVFQVDLVFPPSEFKAGDPPLVRELVTYAGPTEYEKLEAADEKAGFSTGFKEVPDFGWFGVIGRPLLWLLHKFHGLVGNWGLAIVMLTIVVKLLTLYFTTRSMRSMKAMAALAPKMKELQEKYKDDRQKLQQETMGLYKQHGVNPLAGCLPILLQMPIWIALYRMLSSAGELYLEPLVPGWIDDLTSTDPYHILPIVLIATMFGQAKLQPQTTTGMQQKILMYGIPLMFGIASFFFPSGLSLYIVTNTILSALHSIYMNKFDKKGPAMISKITSVKPAGGGGGGGGGGGKSSVKPVKPAKPIIDVEDKTVPAKASAANDDADDDDDDDADDDDDDDGRDDDVDEAPAASAPASPATSAATQSQRARRQSRARRKRRGRN